MRRRQLALGAGLSTLFHLGLFALVMAQLAARVMPSAPPSHDVVVTFADDLARVRRSPAGNPPARLGSPDAPTSRPEPVSAAHPGPGAPSPAAGHPSAAPGENALGESRSGDWRHFFAGDMAGCPREDVALMSPSERIRCMAHPPALGEAPAKDAAAPATDELGALIQGVPLAQDPSSPARACDQAPAGADEKIAAKWRLKAGCKS
jgi:hypothetical protein